MKSCVSHFSQRSRHVSLVSGVGGHRHREATTISALLVCSFYFLPPGSAPEDLIGSSVSSH